MSYSPHISVVIPTYRRPQLLKICLEGLRSQDLPPDSYEVVVVDDGSGPETTDLLEHWANEWSQLVWAAQAENRGPAAARNRAIEMARGPWLLFMDDDIVAPPNLVRTHLEFHADEDPLLGVLGCVRWHPDLRVTPFMRWLDTVDLQFAFESGMSEGRIDRAHDYFYTCNLSVSRDLVRNVGGFNEAFPYPAHEDTELAIRLCRVGFKMDYRPSALGWNSRPITLSDFCHRMELVGESSVILRVLDPDAEHETAPNGTPEGQTRRFARRLLGPMAFAFPFRPIRELYYKSEIWKAQLEGLRKGYERVAAAADGSPLRRTIT